MAPHTAACTTTIPVEKECHATRTTTCTNDCDTDCNNSYTNKYETKRTTTSTTRCRRVESCHYSNIQNLSFPQSTTSTMRTRIDDHIAMYHAHNLLNRQVLNVPIRTVGSTTCTCSDDGNDNDNKDYDCDCHDRVLNVLQGEIAHATSDQVDVIVSDDATTCHILAVRSYRSVDCASSNAGNSLSSIAHLDVPAYEKDLKEMLEEHLRFHNNQNDNIDNINDDDDDELCCQSMNKRRRSNSIHMDLHILGGFDDEEERSIEISEHLLRTLSTFASDVPDISSSIKMKLKTCAVSRMNNVVTTSDNNGIAVAAPIGRGLAMDVRTGDVFLATVDEDCVGPALALRSCRIYGDLYESLNLIHTWSNSSSDDSNSIIRIKPFHFDVFENMDILLALPDEILLQIVSTSPAVEKPNFCSNFRRNLTFLKKNSYEDVFGANFDKYVSYCRCASNKNKNRWEEI